MNDSLKKYTRKNSAIAKKVPLEIKKVPLASKKGFQSREPLQYCLLITIPKYWCEDDECVAAISAKRNCEANVLGF